MNVILKEFDEDLQLVKKQLDAIDGLKAYAGLELPKVDGTEKAGTFEFESKRLHELSRLGRTGFPLSAGIVILYVAGRFEGFTKSLFEDLCQRLTSRARKFRHLPRPMQENLTRYTALAIQTPAKYRFSDGAVSTFVSTLAHNLADAEELKAVNYECLSITEANLKPDVLNELFLRIGAKDIWKRIGQQTNIQTYFGIIDPSQAEDRCKKKLVDLMDLRNRIAHPPNSMEWPSTEAVRDFMTYLAVLAVAMSGLADALEVTLCRSDLAE